MSYRHLLHVGVVWRKKEVWAGQRLSYAIAKSTIFNNHNIHQYKKPATMLRVIKRIKNLILKQLLLLKPLV